MRMDAVIDKVWHGKGGHATYIRYRITSGPLKNRTITERLLPDGTSLSSARPPKEVRDVQQRIPGIVTG